MNFSPIPAEQYTTQLVFQKTSPPPRVPERHPQFESWAAVKIPRKLDTSTRFIIGVFLVFLCILAFVPWTQTIKAQEQLSAYWAYMRLARGQPN